MLKSALFDGDQLLQDIADDTGGVRISQSENAASPSVVKVQKALLINDPGALPVSGADGAFGAESAAAVHRFKAQVLGVPEEEIIDDVGPTTVERLDEIAFASELTSVTLFNQFGETLANVQASIDDAGTLRTTVTSDLGTASVAITAPGVLALEALTLADAVGDLLDRPAIASDPNDSGAAAIVVPQPNVSVNLAPGDQLNIVIVARVDLSVQLRLPLEGNVRIDGTGLRVFQEDASIRVALQVNDGSTATAFLDPPPPAGAPVAAPVVTGWLPPNGYIVQPADTADSLSQRFLGDPGRFAELSGHDPVAGEILTLPDTAVPGWVGIPTAEPLPPAAAPKVWFSVAPNDIVSALFASDGPFEPVQQLLDAIAFPPPADPDPAAVAAANADVVTAFLSLPPELSAADPVTTETAQEGEGLDEIAG